ncbi:hypothetical protein PHYBLDRAFT_113343, partial [Phycomyces blakesleeanus NRRL 1555(-)]
ASTPSERHQLEVENGVQWSQLHRLGYFDLVHGMIIDPMHNLFLETPKGMMDWWIEERKITERDFVTMQKIADKMVVPNDYMVL